MFMYNYLIGWLRPLTGLLCHSAFRIKAFFRHYVLGVQPEIPITGLPGSLLDTDLYKVILLISL